MPVTLITGGARSGKSLRAESLALAGGDRPHYIATAQIEDPDMAARVDIHRQRRGRDWHEHQAGLDLIGALWGCKGPGVRLVDCLTLWLSNLMFQARDSHAEGAALADYLRLQTADVILVTSEVGLGIVPENALARDFRDRLGLLNQQIGAVADHIELVVAGHSLRIKG